MTEKKLAADIYIGETSKKISSISDLFNLIEQSELTANQKIFLALLMLQIFNDELKTANSVIQNSLTLISCKSSLTGTVAGHKMLAQVDNVKKYRFEIEKLQKEFAKFLNVIFQQLYDTEQITATELKDAILHYSEQIPLNMLSSDRSGFSKKIRTVLRGFSGSIRGMKNLKK